MKAEAERDEGDGGHGGETLPTGWSPDDLRARCRSILEAAWRPRPDGSGFCVPNPSTYPWQWLWDSCFHAVVWTRLGDDRGWRELAGALRAQGPDGFVPHIRYDGEVPRSHGELWGSAGASSITQPPMYGHAVAVLGRTGAPLPDEVVERAELGLRFLLERRHRSPAGLVELCHPWESGCDDSPRWDSVVRGGWDPQRWYAAKGDLVGPIERSVTGGPLHNPGFAIGGVGFSALVAWNALELATVTDDRGLRDAAGSLAAAVDARWDESLGTWVDDGPTAGGSGRVRTLDALLPLLVCPRAEAFATLDDADAFQATCGPRGVDAREPVYEPTRYWRGPAWPQLTYLLWLAATSGRAEGLPASLSRSMLAGATRSGFSEYWEPSSGAPLGAAPQSWTALSCVMVDA
ncbi:MAG: MGH1-like glycoside hydrolase domain-containing protein [Acidimicrobiales bacterium]